MFCQHVCIPHACTTCVPRVCSQKSEKGIRSNTGVTDVCKLQCGYWKLKQGALKEQPVLFLSSVLLPCDLRQHLSLDCGSPI